MVKNIGSTRLIQKIYPSALYVLFGWECFESVLSFFFSFVTDIASVLNTCIVVNRLVVLNNDRVLTESIPSYTMTCSERCAGRKTHFLSYLALVSPCIQYCSN